MRSKLGPVLLLMLVGVLAASVAFVACGDDDDDGDATAVADSQGEAEADPEADPEADHEPDPEAGEPQGTPTARVEVSLAEWSVTASQQEVPAGTIEFLVANDGEEVHEFAITRDGEEIFEIEDIEPGTNVFETVSLDPGRYELACHIVETEPNGEVEDHHELGMHTEFEVS